MRLVSKIHDYYDGLFKMSIQDKKATFVRETKTIPKKEIEGVIPVFPRPIYVKIGEIHYEIAYGVIGFCGSIYPYIRVCSSNTYDPLQNSKSFFYDYDSFANKYPEIADGKSVFVSMVYFNVYHRGSLDHIKIWLKDGSIYKYDGTIEDTITKNDKILGMFRKLKVAYFNIFFDHLDPCDSAMYPILKDFQFYKVFDPTTTFQKVEMFLSNDIVPPDDPYIMPVPDKIKAQSKGFDKWSFRKESEKKFRTKNRKVGKT